MPRTGIVLVVNPLATWHTNLAHQPGTPTWHTNLAKEVAGPWYIDYLRNRLTCPTFLVKVFHSDYYSI